MSSANCVMSSAVVPGLAEDAGAGSTPATAMNVARRLPLRASLARAITPARRKMSWSCLRIASWVHQMSLSARSLFPVFGRQLLVRRPLQAASHASMKCSAGGARAPFAASAAPVCWLTAPGRAAHRAYLCTDCALSRMGSLDLKLRGAQVVADTAVEGAIIRAHVGPPAAGPHDQDKLHVTLAPLLETALVACIGPVDAARKHRVRRLQRRQLRLLLLRGHRLAQRLCPIGCRRPQRGLGRRTFGKLGDINLPIPTCRCPHPGDPPPRSQPTTLQIPTHRDEYDQVDNVGVEDYDYANCEEYRDVYCGEGCVRLMQLSIATLMVRLSMTAACSQGWGWG